MTSSSPVLHLIVNYANGLLFYYFINIRKDSSQYIFLFCNCKTTTTTNKPIVCISSYVTPLGVGHIIYDALMFIIPAYDSRINVASLVDAFNECT